MHAHALELLVVLTGLAILGWDLHVLLVNQFIAFSLLKPNIDFAPEAMASRGGFASLSSTAAARVSKKAANPLCVEGGQSRCIERRRSSGIHARIRRDPATVEAREGDAAR